MIFQEYDRNIIWSEENYVVGKDTTLIPTIKDFTSAKTMEFYNGDELSEAMAKDYINATTDQTLIDTCEMMSSLSYDFADDIAGWAKAANGHTYNQIGNFHQDPIVLRKVMEMCGTGYSKLFVLFHKALKKPDVMFLHRPGQSLHPTLSAAVLSHLESYTEDKTKFIITDDNEFVSPKENYY